MCFSITLGGGGAATWGHKITVTVLKFFFLALSHFILIQSSKVGLAGLFYRWGNGFREVKWLTQCHTTDTWLNWVLTKTLLEVTSLALNNCTTKSHFPSLSSNFLKLSSPVSWISPALALGLIAVIKKFKRTLAFKRHRYTFFIQRKSRWGVQDGHGGCSTVHGALSLMEQKWLLSASHQRTFLGAKRENEGPSFYLRDNSYKSHLALLFISYWPKTCHMASLAAGESGNHCHLF